MRSARMHHPALEYLQPQGGTPWDTVWMSDVHRNVSLEGAARLAASQRAQQSWWQQFRLNK